VDAVQAERYKTFSHAKLPAGNKEPLFLRNGDDRTMPSFRT